MYKTLPAYIPFNLDLTEFLEQNPPAFTYNIDNFRYILSLITEIPSFNKDLLDKYNYVPINAQMLQAKVRDYNKYLQYFVENGILETDNKYIPTEKATGYRFTEKYSTIVKVECIKKNSLIKQIAMKTSYQMNMEKKHKYLRKWFNDDLQVDFTSAVAYLTEQLNLNRANGVENALLKFNASFMNLHRLSIQEYYFKVDSTVGRLHTNLTGIKSELRNFITYDGQKMVSIDIVNSQPFTSCVLLNEKFYQNDETGAKLINIYKLPNKYNNFNYTNPSFIMLVKSSQNQAGIDIQQYVTQTSTGQLYEYISAEMEKRMSLKITNRKDLKAIIFTVLFTDNRFFGQKDAEPKRLFQSLFPNVYKLFSMIKAKDSTTLPILLQTIEAKLILDLVVKRLSKELPNVPLFTIHDSVCCPVGYEDKLAMIMKEEIANAIGIAPTLKYDYWTPDNLVPKTSIAA